MNGLRILDTGLAPARWNVAMTAALAELRSRDAIGDTVRFHRYPACVLVGATQGAQLGVDLEYCRRAGIAIARRVTGGGAVYMSPAMLAWDVVLDRAAFVRPFAVVTCKVCVGVAAGLSRFGAQARFRPPNDIEIGGRKVSGSSGYAAGRTAVLQGTILLTDETPAMARALRLPEAALRERTTCLEAEIGAAPSLVSLVDALVAGLAESLDREPLLECLHQDELAACESLLRDEIDGDAYVIGRAATPA